MQWEKLGCVFAPHEHADWMWSHATNPVAEHRGDDLFRVYFSCRDVDNRSSIGWVEVDLTDPTRVVRVAETPVLSPGEAGLFDDSGVSLGCIVTNGSARLLYYVGWNLGVTVPWRNSIGLATSESPDTPFLKVSRAPILDRTDADPFSLSYPWVLRDGGRWRMWYGSNLRWGATADQMEHVIKYAESTDGRTWRRDGTICVPLQKPDEIGVARPCVVHDAARYHMWYSIRTSGYGIGYATSPDGLLWTRRDADAGLAPSATGWDAGAVEYPCVFDHAGDRWMLYNGADHGRTGFGLARLVSR